MGWGGECLVTFKSAFVGFAKTTSYSRCYYRAVGTHRLEQLAFVMQATRVPTAFLAVALASCLMLCTTARRLAIVTSATAASNAGRFTGSIINSQDASPQSHICRLSHTEGSCYAALGRSWLLRSFAPAHAGLPRRKAARKLLRCAALGRSWLLRSFAPVRGC